MPQKLWTGSINFGLVTIPVALYAATQDRTVQFHQYQRGTTDRVRYKRVNERTGDEVEYDDIVKGREVGDELVLVEPQELEDIAPGRSRTIDIARFVDLGEIDPIFFQKTYWLAPTAAEQSRPYHLLRQAMRSAERVGIAKFVLRGKEYLTAVRGDETVLSLETMFFADDIRDPAAIVAQATKKPGAQASAEPPSKQELTMANTLIDSMSGAWEPESYQDEYTARVEQLLADKAAGRTPQPEAEPEQPGKVVDLTDALRRSVESLKAS